MSLRQATSLMMQRWLARKSETVGLGIARSLSTLERQKPPMSNEEFRSAGYQLIDWIADYWENIEEYPVLSQAKSGDLRKALPSTAPRHPEEWSEIMKDLNKLIIPRITHWQSPNFFAFFNSNASPPSVLGELASAGLGVQGMLWATSPACTELETHMLDWIVDLCGLPERFRSTGKGGGVIQDSASSSILVAILSARERTTSRLLGGEPCRLEQLVAYTSEHAHSCVFKGLRIAGISCSQLREIPCDENYAMDPEKLREAIAADVAANLRPFFVMGTTGTTSSTAMDPIDEIAAVCEEFGNIWLHVDGAFAGSAAVVPELREMVNRGLDRVDSYDLNPHKWLLTNFDCSLFWVADRTPMIAALGAMPEYLRNSATEQGAVIDYRDWQVPLGRRFRALKLWFVIRTYGATGMADYIRNHVKMAQDLAARLDAHESYESVAPTPLSLVTFRHLGGDAENERIRDAINASGNAYLTHTRLSDQTVLRIAVSAVRTEQRHVDALFDQLDRLAVSDRVQCVSTV